MSQDKREPSDRRVFLRVLGTSAIAGGTLGMAGCGPSFGSQEHPLPGDAEGAEEFKVALNAGRGEAFYELRLEKGAKFSTGGASEAEAAFGTGEPGDQAALR